MKYMGSKAKYAKYLLPYILADRKPNQYYVEPFVGGANMIDKVNGNRIGNDINNYIIALFKALQYGWILPVIDKELYNDINSDKDMYSPELVGYVGICCSYSGKWFGGYAGVVNTKQGIRDYQEEAKRNLMAQLPGLQNVEFKSQEYFDLKIPENSIIYCDPPYEGTTKYFTSFNHNYFWQWCRDKKQEGHQVFISEYKAPEDFKCLVSLNAKSSLSANGAIGGNKNSIEKLFTL